MVSLETLRSLSAAGEPWPLLPADRIVSHLPALVLAASEALALIQGRIVQSPTSLAAQSALEGRAPLWRLYDAESRFLGLGSCDTAGQLRSRRLFPAPVALA